MRQAGIRDFYNGQFSDDRPHYNKLNERLSGSYGLVVGGIVLYACHKEKHRVDLDDIRCFVGRLTSRNSVSMYGKDTEVHADYVSEGHYRLSVNGKLMHEDRWVGDIEPDLAFQVKNNWGAWSLASAWRNLARYWGNSNAEQYSR